MADPVSICQSILSLVVKVRGTLAKFHTNKKECNGVLTLVAITEAVVEPLQGQPDIVKTKGMSAALAGLNKALQDASEVVRGCQKKSSARGFLEADAISKDLLEVEKEILKYVKLVNLATDIGTRLILTDIAEKQAADLRTSNAHPDYQQVQKPVQTRRSSTEYPGHQIERKMGTKKTDVAGRLEGKNEKDKAPAADIKTPQASLSPDGSAKFTSVKSVIGQDGPCTANKDLSHRSNPGNGVGSSKKDKIKEIYGPNATGSKNKTEKTNVPDDSNGSRAFLSYAKSTPVKSVDGQGHPRIVTKMISSSTRNMDRVKTIDMHPTEPWIVTGDMDGKVCIWNYEKQEPVMEKLVTKARTSVKEKHSKYYVYSTKFITKMNWLVVGDGRGYIHVYDYTNSKLTDVGKLKAHNDSSVDLLAVHPTKTCLLSLSAYGKKIILWNWSDGALKKDQEFDITPACPDCVVSLKFHPWHSNTFACVIDKKLMIGNIKFHSLILKRKGLSVADYFFNRTDQPLMVTLSTSSRDAEILNLETGILVVHGHWCYKRIAQMICYFFYKNITFGLTIFYFEAFAGFSGQSVYDDSFMLLFNVVLTSLPVISLGVFEQDVPSEICLQFPALYQQGPKNLFFDWYRILGWMGNGLYSSLAIFFLNICIFYDQAIRAGGQTADMAAVGTTMFTCIIWAVNMQIALTMSHFTWIQHLFVWGSITTWYLFILAYGMLVTSRDNYKILLEVLGPAPVYWAATLLVTAACNIPYLIHISYQRMCNPLDHHVIQEIKCLRKDVEDQTMWKRERSKARQKTKIGFTARVDAKIKQIRGKLHKKGPALTIHTVS